MSENIINVATNLINTDGRFRKDFGDIPALLALRAAQPLND